MSDIYVGLEREPGMEREKAVLVGISRMRGEGRRSMQELIGLARAAGAAPVDVVVQNRNTPHLQHFIGKGKLEELRAVVTSHGAEIILFDGELTPAQIRNLVDAFECKILDRTELILDIFAQHARTRIGKLQVELAQLSYMLPRLTGRGKMMDRITARGGSGGVGVRGPGETKLETDRRRLRQRIMTIRARLAELGEHRDVERNKRRESNLPLISLVGYTNAGKSSLLNALCGSEEVRANDRLFETLDTTVRNVDLGDNRSALVADTVGFIRNLPEDLIEAFKATLEETLEADLLIQVIDAGDPWAETENLATREVLFQLGAHEKPMLIALNKWDTVSDPGRESELLGNFTEAVPVSAVTGEGLDELRERARAMLPTKLIPIRLHLPYSELQLLELPRRTGRLLDTRYQPEYVAADAEVDEPTLARLRPYVVSSD
ncbi:MAG: GTPase HflX [Armatimonadetes bacterium]|jgi:GTP-binding protein HflX|nr:GTPase HflX [Armatimonadota bacterium]